jgi:DNA topoisomerase IB
MVASKSGKIERYGEQNWGRNFLPYVASWAASQQRSKVCFAPNLFKNLANFVGWREAQSSIRIQEGPPKKIRFAFRGLLHVDKGRLSNSLE